MISSTDLEKNTSEYFVHIAEFYASKEVAQSHISQESNGQEKLIYFLDFPNCLGLENNKSESFYQAIKHLCLIDTTSENSFCQQFEKFLAHVFQKGYELGKKE